MATEDSSNVAGLIPAIPSVPASLRKLISKPSWIGRIPVPRSSTPGLPAMKQDVRISYSSSGLCPPVYLVSSITEPQWEPVELDSTTKDDGELEFSKVFQVEEGEYQYKFRLGPGDWWALDESKPIVDDGDGNRNNTINVEAPQMSQEAKIEAPTTSADSSRASIDDQPPPVPAKDIPAAIYDNALKIVSPVQEKLASIPPAIGVISQPPATRGPSPLLTPPMTPDMKFAQADDFAKFQPFEARIPQRSASVCSDRSVEEGAAVVEQDKNPASIDRPVIPREQPEGFIAAFKFFILSLGSWLITVLGGRARATGALAIFVGLVAMAYRIRDTAGEVLPTIFSYLPFTGKKNGTLGHSAV